MPLVLGIERLLDFDLEIETLGQVRCSSLGSHSSLEKSLRDSRVDGPTVARQVLGLVGKRVRPAEGADAAEELEERLTDDEVQQLTDQEIECFAREFIAHNQWLLHSYDNGEREVGTNERGERVVSYKPTTIDLPKESDERDSDYLVRVLRRHSEEWAKRFRELSTKLFSNSTQESLRRNLGLSDQLGEVIRASHRRLLGAGLADTRSEPSLHSLPDLAIPKIPESPLVETNRRLNRAIDHIEDVRHVVAKSAELIRSMNDVALRMQADWIRNTRRNEILMFIVIVIAVVSLLVQAAFSWWSYTDDRQRVDRADRLFRAYQDESHALSEAQGNRLEGLLRLMETNAQQRTRQERAALVEALKEALRDVRGAGQRVVDEPPESQTEPEPGRAAEP